MTPLEVALDYIGRGWSPIPVRFRGKKPLHDDWSKLRITRGAAAGYFNCARLNVGVLMGEASGGLADVDLDCPEALALAARFLPPTGSVFGREGKPDSHRLFTSAVPKTVQFQDPDGGGMLLELRSTGGQTVFPPSIHESGERIDWTGFDEPMQVDEVRLASTASDLAVACLLVRAAPVESRHDYLLDIAGALIRAHQDAAGRIHHAVAQQILGKLYNKAEGDRLLDETATRIARKDPACGWPRLVERIGEKRARSVAHWLGFVPSEERPHRRGTAAQPNEWPEPRGKAKPREAPKANGDARATDRSDLPIILTGGPLDHARQLVGLEFTHPEGRRLHRHRGGFHVWGGASYREITIEGVREIVYRFYERCRRKIETDQGVELVKIKPHRRMVGDFVDALMAEVFLRDDVAVPSWLKGTGPADLIPMHNGLLDLGTGKLHPHSPRYFGSYSLPFDYDPTPTPPFQWLRFLKGLWPKDREARRTLQEMIGLLLTADTRHQKIFLLVGPKRSGKGTIARIIRQLLGPENVAGPTLGGLTTNFGSQCLIGKPAAIISDARLSSRSDAAVIAERLLSISGEDVQTVDRKHRDPWTGMLPTRFLILTNELPKISDASGALASRFIVLTLTQSFYGHEDHGLLNRLLPELPGIFAWALAGQQRLAKRGRLVMPASSAAAVERLEMLSSPIAAFLRDECIVRSGATIPCKGLYDHWRAWCEQQGRDHPGTAQAFGNDLHSAVPGLRIIQPRDGFGGRWRAYEGVRLRCSNDDLAPSS